MTFIRAVNYTQDRVDHSGGQKLVQPPFVSSQVKEYLSIRLRDFLSLVYCTAGYWAPFAFNEQILVQTALTSGVHIAPLKTQCAVNSTQKHACIFLFVCCFCFFSGGGVPGQLRMDGESAKSQQRDPPNELK